MNRLVNSLVKRAKQDGVTVSSTSRAVTHVKISARSDIGLAGSFLPAILQQNIEYSIELNFRIASICVLITASTARDGEETLPWRIDRRPCKRLVPRPRIEAYLLQALYNSTTRFFMNSSKRLASGRSKCAAWEISNDTKIGRHEDEPSRFQDHVACQPCHTSSLGLQCLPSSIYHRLSKGNTPDSEGYASISSPPYKLGACATSKFNPVRTLSVNPASLKQTQPPPAGGVPFAWTA